MGVLNLSKVKAVVFEVPVTVTLENGAGTFSWPAGVPVSFLGKSITITEPSVNCAIMENAIACSGQTLQVFRVDRIENVS